MLTQIVFSVGKQRQQLARFEGKWSAVLNYLYQLILKYIEQQQQFVQHCQQQEGGDPAPALRPAAPAEGDKDDEGTGSGFFFFFLKENNTFHW